MSSWLGLGGSSRANRPLIYGGLQVSSSQRDMPVPIFWGQRRLGTEALWYNDFQKHKQSAKGKGGGGKGAGQYTYSAAVIVALCEGVVDDIVNVFQAGSSTTTTTLSQLNMTFYDGSASQVAPSFVTTKYPSQARSNAYTALLFSPKLDLGSSASIPDNSYECVRSAGFSYTHSTNGWINPQTHVATPAIDVLMSDVILDLLTSPQYGIGGLTAGDIGSMTQYATYQRAQGLFFSPLLNRQEKVTSLLDRWAQLTNSWIYWSGTQLQFVPLGDSVVTGNGVTYTPDQDPAYHLDLDDFLDKESPVKVTRAPASDCYSRTSLQITNRNIGYVSDPLEYKDQTLVDEFGDRDPSSTQADEICDPDVGRIVVQLLGKRAAYIRNNYAFKTNFRFVRCIPGTIVTLTTKRLNALPVRIKTVEEDEDGSLSFTAEEFPGNIGTYTSAVQTASAPVATTPNQNMDPGASNVPAVIEPDSAYTGGAAQLIIAASGGASWGGCQVNISFNQTDYQNIGNIIAPAAQGVLTAPLASHVDPDTVNTLSVDGAESLATPQPVTTADADALRTLSLVCARPTVVGPTHNLDANGELLAFGNVATTGTYTADLTYLRRGQYGTSPASHSAGDAWTLIDVLGTTGTSLVFPLPKEYIGVPIYIKLCSFNPFNNTLQDLSTAVEYCYTPTGRGFGGGTGGVPTQPTGLSGLAGIQQAMLSWNSNPSADNVTGYEVWGALGASVPFGSTAKINTVGGLGYTVTGLAPNQAYTFYIVARNSVGPSVQSAGINVTTLATQINIAGVSFSCQKIETKTLNAVVTGFTPIYSWTWPSVAHGGFVTGYVDVAPVADTDFDVLKDGLSIATIRWTAGSHTPTLIKASDTALTTTDYLDLKTPASLNGMSGVFRLSIAGVR